MKIWGEKDVCVCVCVFVRERVTEMESVGLRGSKVRRKLIKKRKRERERVRDSQ